MPSHIFTRGGAWADSVATNERSAVAAKAKRYYAKLVAMAGQGTPRPEIMQARAYLTSNP